MISWISHDPQARKISVTEQASIFSTKKPVVHYNMSVICTKSPLSIQNYRKNDPPSLFYGQSFPASVTPKQNSTPYNNPTKPVPCVPIGPDSDPS